MRRWLWPFALVALLVTAGCVGAPGDAAPGTSPTPETSPTPDGTPTPSGDSTPGQDDPDAEPPLNGSTVEWPAGPKDRPAIPASLTEPSVRAFVGTFEYRYVYNNLYVDEGTNVSLDCSVQSVTSQAEGYTAVVECTGYSNTRTTVEPGGRRSSCTPTGSPRPTGTG
ncbi:MAG: hypothetical protein ABEJ30_07395 [Halorientalis sp.]